MVYVKLQDEKIFAVIDPATAQIVGRYRVGRCKGNHGMTLDPEHHHAFLSCEGNDLMTVFDLDKQQPIAFLPMAGGPDVIKFDSGLERVYVACSSGAISVFQVDDPAHYRKLGHFPVQKRVRNLAVDRETHGVYAPEQEADGKAVASSTEEPAHGCTIAAPALPAAACNALRIVPSRGKPRSVSRRSVGAGFGLPKFRHTLGKSCS
jgi:DNA-binding beta-propeller fold protein YncE